MKVCWVKIWIASMATLTERFRDDEGRVDFEALGREEYAFRHALITGDYYKSERARDLAEAAEKDYKIHSENGKKGGRPKKLTAAATTSDGVDVVSDRDGGLFARTTGCNHSQVAPTSNAGDESSDAGNGAALKSDTACNHYDQEALDKPTISANSPAGAGVNLDSTQTIKRPDASSGNAEGVNLHGSTITRNVSRAACTSATSGQTIETLQNTGAAGDSHEFSSSPAVLPVPAKRPHGEFGNVLLTDDEFAKLCEKCADADSLITELDQYIESQGKAKKYKSHYATLLNWSRRKAQEATPRQGFKTAAEKQRDELQKISDYYASKEVVG